MLPAGPRCGSIAWHWDQQCLWWWFFLMFWPPGTFGIVKSDTMHMNASEHYASNMCYNSGAPINQPIFHGRDRMKRNPITLSYLVSIWYLFGIYLAHEPWKVGPGEGRPNPSPCVACQSPPASQLPRWPGGLLKGRWVGGLGSYTWYPEISWNHPFGVFLKWGYPQIIHLK